MDIENFSDGNDDVILEKVNLKAKKPDVKKKRVISDDQKKILVDRLAYARSLRKKESENKKALEEDYLKQKEDEINERLMKKFTSLQRKKENEMMKKYMAKPTVESESEEEEVIIKKAKPKPKPKKKIIYQYEEEDDNDNGRPPAPPAAPATTSVYFC